jgi:signal transduction histidine kinase/CheY-like chemotaxis protein
MTLGAPTFQTSDAPPSVADEALVEAKIRLARVVAVHDGAGTPLVASFVFVAAMVAMLHDQVPAALLGWWVAARCLVATLRLTEIAAFRREAHPLERSKVWARRFVALLVPDALSWSALTVLFLPYANASSALVLFAAAIATSAVGAFTNWHMRVAGIAFTGLVVLPVALDQALHYGATGLYTGISACLYFGMLALEVVRAQTLMTDNLRLRFGYAQLAEQRRQALAEAQAASAAKSRFMAAVSHEIRTPLNGVVGMAHMLRQLKKPELMTQRLDVLHQSARHLQSVVNDLVDLGRLDLGRLDLRLDPMAPGALATEVTELLRPLAVEKRLGLALQMADDVPAAVLADAARVRQVLYNLLGNALKFTTQGQVLLAVQATPKGLCFTVTDTGPGIPPDSLSRVFDAFEQAGPEAASRRAGAGLGLTISRELARAMGGDIQCQSTLGQGTRFDFELIAPTCAAPDPAAADAPDDGLPLQGHVLVVDDHPVNAMVAESLLEDLGITCEVAVNGQQALDRLAEKPFSLVLMDCLMPVMDGYEATRQQRAREQTTGAPRIPIIALTANAVGGDREACAQAGMDDYLTKPFDLAQLEEMLLRHLPRPSSAPPPSALESQRFP